MARSTTKRGSRTSRNDNGANAALAASTSHEPTAKAEEQTHILRPGAVCDTDPRGHALPRGRSPLEIVVDASEGFIPLWAKNTTLRWRFRERSMSYFANPTAAKKELRKLLGEAILAWGTAAPVKFTEDVDVYDFELVMRKAADCDAAGCTLASAFFPDSGRHKLELYPTLFEQPRDEQVETLVHEMGHVFGLRHFFANISEKEWPVELFGSHNKFSIMNYGDLSELTDEDKSDLRTLYQLAWSGKLTNINGTPIRFVKPFHTLSPSADRGFNVVNEPVIHPAFQPAAAMAVM
jgi:hypothetical protein